jgi:hypothetical protein
MIRESCCCRQLTNCSDGAADVDDEHSALGWFLRYQQMLLFAEAQSAGSMTLRTGAYDIAMAMIEAEATLYWRFPGI